MTVVRTISASFAITGADSVTEVLGGAPLWAVPAAGVEYDADAQALVANGPAPAFATPRGWTVTRTLSGVTDINGQTISLRGNDETPSGRAVLGSALAERLGLKPGDRVVVGGESLVVDESGSGQSLTVASSLAQTVVGSNGWWLVFAPPGDESKRDLGRTFAAEIGLESTPDPSVMPDPGGRGLIYDTVGGSGPLTFEQSFSALFSGKVTSSTLGLISIIGLGLGFVIAVSSSLAAVQERRREFGIMSSIGLADEVLYFFLVESAIVFIAACMHEEDFGISWKHTDFRTEEVEVRRSRRLVISMICTVGNYEYGFFWYFYNDASMEVEVKLSGVLTTGAVPDGKEPRWGKMVAPNIYGPNHQHFFNFRLDMSVDGAGNSVYEVDSIPEPDPALNPHRNAWITQDTLVASEAEGARDWNWSAGRYWKVTNPSKKNELGSPVAYKLVPKEIVPVMVQEGSYIYDRARFVQHNMWVTKYDPAEKFAAGDYMYQSEDAQGLPEFVSDDAPLENTDVVLWYTLGAHHVVRPEDWPVMPCAYTGFHLKPLGFFDGNPALDLPPSPPKACHHH